MTFGIFGGYAVLFILHYFNASSFIGNQLTNIIFRILGIHTVENLVYTTVIGSFFSWSMYSVIWLKVYEEPPTTWFYVIFFIFSLIRNSANKKKYIPVANTIASSEAISICLLGIMSLFY